MEEKVYIFSKEEFVILAAASGIREMYGFEMIGVGEQTEELLLNMQKLVTKGYLYAEGEKFLVQEPVKSMFLQIKDVQTTIDVHKRSGKKCIVYIGDFCVRVSPSFQRKGMLEVQMISLKEIWNFLREEGWIPVKEEVKEFDFS